MVFLPHYTHPDNCIPVTDMRDVVEDFDTSIT